MYAVCSVTYLSTIRRKWNLIYVSAFFITIDRIETNVLMAAVDLSEMYMLSSSYFF
jgi:hypothetical protein